MKYIVEVSTETGTLDPATAVPYHPDNCISTGIGLIAGIIIVLITMVVMK